MHQNQVCYYSVRLLPVIFSLHEAHNNDMTNLSGCQKNDCLLSALKQIRMLFLWVIAPRSYVGIHSSIVTCHLVFHHNYNTIVLRDSNIKYSLNISSDTLTASEVLIHNMMDIVPHSKNVYCLRRSSTAHVVYNVLVNCSPFSLH